MTITSRIFSNSFALRVSLAFLLFMNVLACTRPTREATLEEKKRGLTGDFAPGTTDGKYNVNLFKVMTFPSDNLNEQLLEEKALKIRTKKVGEKVPVSISVKEVTVNSRRSFVKPYYLVDYDILKVNTNEQELLAKLVGQIDDFKGFPDTVYHIVPDLQDNYLTLYRIADQEKLPYNEIPLSVKVGDKSAVPLVGYSIKYCVTEERLDSNHKKTGQLRFKCEGVTKEEATFISLGESSKSVFSYLSKVDIYRSDFFVGDWFFVETIIKSSGDKATGFGRHQGFENAALVEFEKTSDSLEAVDTKKYQLDEKDTVSNFSIPVEWKEYKIRGDSGTLDKYAFSEEEKITTQDIERPYFIINFKKLAGQNQEIGNINIEDDYFSFIIRTRGSSNQWKKYAFKRAVENKNYVQKRWFEKDSTVFFPTYFVYRKYYRVAKEHTEQDQEKYIRTTRFDPQSHDGSNVKVIKWYFSKQTPRLKWVRDFGRVSVDYWDKAFQEAGKDSEYKIRIVLCDPDNPHVLCNENEDKELGDIRYNILNLMYSEHGQSAPALGFGPNISNPITGETIAATTNVWVNGVINQYVGLIRKYIRFHVYPPAWKLFPESPGVTDFIESKMKKLCTDVTAFILFEQEKKEIFHPTKSLLNDADITWDCAKKLSEVDTSNTTLHEMGHGFTYRHVYTGSADKDNFYKSYDEIKRIFGEGIDVESMDDYPNLPNYSTVMDYAHPFYPGLSVPGKLDIAMTKFVYFDQVELEGGGVLHVPAGEKKQRPILDVAEEKGITVKQYKICGGTLTKDEDLDDPLCARHDYGVTPKEIVENMIRVHQDAVMTMRNRYDSRIIQNPVDKTKDFKLKTLHKIMRIMNKSMQYINELLQSHGMKITDYFFLNEEEVLAYKDLLENEKNSNPEFKLYYESRQPFLEYAKKLFFLPIKHCVYESSEGEYKAVALEVIKKRIEGDYPDESREVFMNCESTVVQQWAKDTQQGKLITEVGYFGQDREYFVKPKNEDPWDELSIFTFSYVSPQHYQMMKMFGLHTRVGHSHWVEALVTSGVIQVFLSSPVFAKDVIGEMKEYILGGTDLNPYLDRSRMEDKYKNINVPRVLSYEVDSMVGSLLSPQARILPVHHHHVPYALLSLRIAVVGRYIASLYPLLQEDEKEKLESYYTTAYLIDTIKLNQINESVQKDDVEALSAEEMPFLLEMYEEYKKQVGVSGQGSTPSFIPFFRNHPLTCTQAGSSRIYLPHSSTNVAAMQCKNFNTYKKCIEEDSVNQPCEDIDNKEVHNQYFLNLINSNIAAQK